MSKRSAGGWRLLWPALLLSGVGYVGLAWRFPLRPNLGHVPAADILSLAHSLRGGLAYAALLCLLFILLIIAFRSVWFRGLWRPDPEHASWQSLATILGITLIFGLPLVWTYPINATDIFRYAQQGRLSSVYAGNPFTEPLTDYPEDPFFPLAGEWAGETTPYGPVWEGVAAVVAGVTAPRPIQDMTDSTPIVFKGAGLISLMSLSAVLWALLSKRPANQRAAFVILLAWNPALLITFVANGHNDGLMLFWLLLGALGLQRGRPVIGLLLVVMAILTKPIAALALPIFLISELRRQANVRAGLRLVLVVTTGAILLTGLAFLPWARQGGWAVAPLGLVARLMREASGGAGFSPVTFVYFAFEKRGLPVSIEVIGRVFLALFVLFYVGQLWQMWRGRSTSRTVADTFTGYMIQALNFRIWYAVWPFPFLIQDAAEQDQPNPSAPCVTYGLRAGFWFLLTTQLSVIIYSHVRIFLLDESDVSAHLIGVPFTFLLPLVLAWWPWFPIGERSKDQGQGRFTPPSGQLA